MACLNNLDTRLNLTLSCSDLFYLVYFVSEIFDKISRKLRKRWKILTLKEFLWEIDSKQKRTPSLLNLMVKSKYRNSHLCLQRTKQYGKILLEEFGIRLNIAV